MGRQRKLSDADRRAIYRLHQAARAEAGVPDDVTGAAAWVLLRRAGLGRYTVRGLADAYGVSWQTAYRAVTAMGRRQKADPRRVGLCADWEAGLRRMGWDPHALPAWLSGAHLRFELAEYGLPSVQDLARTYGVHYSTAIQWVRASECRAGEPAWDADVPARRGMDAGGMAGHRTRRVG